MPNTQLSKLQSLLRMRSRSRNYNSGTSTASSSTTEDDMHATGLYLHQEKTSRKLSFLFGAQNPPPEIWVAHEKVMQGVASEEDEDLVLTFLTHHPFQVGNVTNKLFWRTSEESALLTMEGHPLSFVDPETTSQSFIPIRVSPIKQADRRLVAQTKLLEDVRLENRVRAW
ncbi:MAG: hypothetical protein Q9183_005250 [Haloplaca sp. 2 TL-2023]